MSGARNLQPLPFTSLFRGLRTTLVLLVSAVVCGCASSLPSQVDRPVTAALEAPQSTPLGSLVQQLRPASVKPQTRSEEHTSELQSQSNLVCRLLLEKKKKSINTHTTLMS